MKLNVNFLQSMHTCSDHDWVHDHAAKEKCPGTAEFLKFGNFQIVVQLILVLVGLWISCTTTRKSTNLRILSVTGNVPPLTGNVVVEDVAQVDLERTPGGVLQEAERRKEALVLFDHVHLLGSAGQEGPRDASRARADFHNDLWLNNKWVIEGFRTLHYDPLGKCGLSHLLLLRGENAP